jgi:hypothetical protein
MSTIQPTLKRMFDRHRIIFWYDAKKELRQDFEKLDMPGVEKIEIDLDVAVKVNYNKIDNALKKGSGIIRIKPSVPVTDTDRIFKGVK